MANVEHSALTGSNLHEPKGIATATASTIYIADGLGSGSWTTAGLASLASVAKSFETQLFQAEDQKTSGTNGGTFTSGNWQTRTFNQTPTNGISGASLASNIITLPAGTYFCIASAPAYDVTGHQIKLRNATDSTDLIYGSSEQTRGDGDPQTRSILFGRFTLASGKDVILQHRCTTTKTSNGLGVATSFGAVSGHVATTEVYSQILIWKVA